jgi:ATP-dependent Clp protease adaptor protein ClpS|tara:strand:+ start:5985 stop:6296 length:312 start_codon:yes stop_codon:yes gene_type:complete
MTSPDINTVTKTKIELHEPPMFKIIYLNDNKTSVDFVVESLITHFKYNSDTAIAITQDIHSAGSAVVAVLPFEIAEQKGIEVTIDARNHDYPLQIKLEPETIR